MSRAFFFDRDGIVNRRIVGDYVKKIEEFVFNDGFFELFKAVKGKGFLAILVTNQQGIGKGLMTEDDLEEIHRYMNDKLMGEVGYSFDAIYFCSDLDGTGSKRRKPETGMFEEAIERFGIDASSSWTIGDSVSDVKAGKSIGTQTILVGSHLQNELADYLFPSIADVKEFFDKNVN